MSSIEPERPVCYLCGRPTYDPDKRERPWVRATSGGQSEQERGENRERISGRSRIENTGH